MSSGPVIHKVVDGQSFRPAAKPGMRLEIEHWRPVECLRSEDKPIQYRLNPKVGMEALIDMETKESDVVLNLGLDHLCALGFQSGGGTKFCWAGIGTDATSAARNQSGLIAEVMRNPATYTKDAPTGEASVDGVFSIAVSGYSLNECGLVNISGSGLSGLWYSRDTYTTKNVISGDSVNLYYTASFSGA